MREGSKYGRMALMVVVTMIFGSALLWRCANIASPQGGLRDSLPPNIMGATPGFNTVNFDGDRITVTFDEYIQLKDQSKEFFTSPMMKRKPMLLVKGRSIQIDISDTLEENTTYALNFGSSVQDNNENNPLNGFRYVFSTGGEIDSMIVSGYAVDANKKDSVSKALFFFYEASDSAFMRRPYLMLDSVGRADTVPAYDSTLFKVQPAVLARAENNGIVIAQNLKPVDYRVYAIQDENGNFSYEPGTDMVGFLDGVYNPLTLSDFSAWFDTTRMYLTAEPQIYVRMFTDKQLRRQNLAEKRRPQQHKIELIFNAPHPQIDSLTFDSIPAEDIITEYVGPTRDTINLWLDVPGDQLPDTVKGRITYHKPDSLNNLVPTTEQLKLFWRLVETRDQERERERETRDRERAQSDGQEYVAPKKPNPFKFTNSVRSELNPEHNVELEFDYPLVKMDSSRISLTRLGEAEGEVYNVRYRLAHDTANLHKWVISAPWSEGQKYELMIPDSTLVNVAGETNDSIKSTFTVLTPDKFGSIAVHLTGATDEALYVLQLLNDKNALLQEKKFAKTGDYNFRFVSPGDVKLRVVEDKNGNGQWDTGDMIIHRQPEQVEVYVPDTGNELISIKMGWEMELDLDMNALFKPFDIEDIREGLRKSEEVRAERVRQEREKRLLEQENQQNQSGQQGMGFGSGFGGTSGGMGGGAGGFGGMGGMQPF